MAQQDTPGGWRANKRSGGVLMDVERNEVLLHYWLEDIDLSGATTLHGPVSTRLQAPTAVTLTAMEAQAASPGGNVSAWGALVAGLIGVAGALGVRRRSRAG